MNLFKIGIPLILSIIVSGLVRSNPATEQKSSFSKTHSLGQSSSYAPAAVDGTTDSMHLSKYGKGIVYYAQVDKAGDYFRRMFIDSASARVVKKTGKLPENALLFLETWFGNRQSTTFIRQKVKGEWLSNSFRPNAPVYSVALTSSCNSCHAAAKITDDAFTLPLIRKALRDGITQRIECNETATTPCDLAVYQGK